MEKKGRQILAIFKYTVSIAVAAGLLYYVFKDIRWEDFLSRFDKVDFRWVYLSIALSLIAFVARAYRWNVLIHPLGYQLNTWRTLLAVMVGYLVNLAIPRAGEISRCAILKRMDGVPMTQSFGTVVTERIFDLLMLIILLALGFILEFDKLYEFFSGVMTRLAIDPVILIISACSLFLLGILFLVFFGRIDRHLSRFVIYNKLRGFVVELLNGLLSFTKMKHKTGFVLSTILIWVTYFYMSYVMVFALEETSELSHLAGLAMLVGAGIALSIPVQGGFGTYHVIVSTLLLLYGIDEVTGKFFATLLHTSQIVTIALFGAISFVISFLIRKNSSDGHLKEDSGTESSD